MKLLSTILLWWKAIKELMSDNYIKSDSYDIY